MFEQIKLLGPAMDSIILETRKGRRIENVVEGEPPAQKRMAYELWVQKFGQNWKERKPATGVYNCAGLVWACRRTSILQPSEWINILRDDGYRRIQDGSELPQPGDVVAYVDTEVQEMLHVARVIGSIEGFSRDSQRFPMAVSKWNSVSGESIHRVNDDPYRKYGYQIRIEFWTDRPLKAGENAP